MLFYDTWTSEAGEQLEKRTPENERIFLVYKKLQNLIQSSEAEQTKKRTRNEMEKKYKIW